MVFGLNENQREILAYLYSLKDTPKSPPDPRLSIQLHAKNLGILQKGVRKLMRGLVKRRYIGSVIIERRRHYYILPRGIRVIEKLSERRTEWEFSSERIGVKREKRELD